MEQPRASEYAADSAVQAIRRIVRAMDLRSRYLAAHCGLTGPQVVVLHLLGHCDGLTIGRLGASAQLSQATVTGIVDRLERRALLRRQRSQDDKRRVRVWLTDDGREMLRQAEPVLRGGFEARFAQLQQWEQTQLVASLQRVAAMMEAGELAVQTLIDSSATGTGQMAGDEPGAALTVVPAEAPPPEAPAAEAGDAPSDTLSTSDGGSRTEVTM